MPLIAAVGGVNTSKHTHKLGLSGTRLPPHSGVAFGDEINAQTKEEGQKATAFIHLGVVGMHKAPTNV